MPDTGSTAGINIGDAVVNFVGDMTQLDQGVDRLTDRIESGMTRASANVGQLDDALETAGETAVGAGEEIDGAMGRSSGSIREAKGEAMLLGEAFGVHLPRHVNSFIATLPGVGEALESAFAATAVLFIIEAIVKLTEKTTEFISTTFIYTEAMKAADEALKASNKQHADAIEALAKEKKAFEDSLDPIKAQKKAHEELKDAIALEEEQIKKLQNTVATAAVAVEGFWGKAVNYALAAMDKIAGTHLLESHLIQQQLDANTAAQAKQDNDLLALQDKHNRDVEALREQDVTAERAAAKAKADSQFEYWGDQQRAYEAMIAENDKLVAANEKLMASMSKRATLQETVVAGADKGAIEHMKELVKAMDEQGKAIDNTARSIAPFAADFNSAFVAAASGAEGWGKAMEGATGQALQALAQWCQAQAVKNLAEGLAAAANPFTAAQAPGYFAAAAEFEAAALAAGVAGAVVSGAGGGGSAGGGGAYSGTGTTHVTSGAGAAPGPASTTTRLAGGGLISAPTMAMIGDSASGGPANEAVMPLDSPEAMAKIAGAIAPHLASMMGGGGGRSHTFNATMFGQLKNSDLKKLTKQINQAVNKGTVTLNSTRTGRIVKRSA
jgi:hypothetical protein